MSEVIFSSAVLCLLKFERKPIQSIPTCAMCGRPVKVHTLEEIKNCSNNRRNTKVTTNQDKKL